MTFLHKNKLAPFLLILTLTQNTESNNKTNLPTLRINGTLTTTAITTSTQNNESTGSITKDDEEEKTLTSIKSYSPSISKTTHMNHDVDEVLRSEERPWWFKDAIQDIAYHLRSHKFNEYDRRYNRNGSKVDRTNFKYFPKPPLRALHWEVHKYCESSFLHCIDYLRKKLRHASLKRQDDTAVAVEENKWGPNDTQKTSQVDMECIKMRNVDDQVAPPFEGPLERYQWKTTASYFMCWYTMNEVSDLKHLGGKCDNFAYCLDTSTGPYNNDPRADDNKEFACAQYSFCPDTCCANKRLERLDFCWDDEENPCFHENSAGQRECVFNRRQNTDFSDLILNRWNVTCKCPQEGYLWNSLYGICVDIDECTDSKLHGCTSQGQACVNLPGTFSCICKWGYIYREQDKTCIESDALSEIRLTSQEKNKTDTTNKWKWFMTAVVNALGRSCSPSGFDSFRNVSLLLPVVVMTYNVQT